MYSINIVVAVVVVGCIIFYVISLYIDDNGLFSYCIEFCVFIRDVCVCVCTMMDDVDLSNENKNTFFMQ